MTQTVVLGSAVSDALGRTAFQAYAEHVQGVTHDGRVIPPWEEIAPETQEAWSVSVRAALELLGFTVAVDVSRETSPEGDTHG